VRGAEFVDADTGKVVGSITMLEQGDAFRSWWRLRVYVRMYTNEHHGAPLPWSALLRTPATRWAITALKVLCVGVILNAIVGCAAPAPCDRPTFADCATDTECEAAAEYVRRLRSCGDERRDPTQWSECMERN